MNRRGSILLRTIPVAAILVAGLSPALMAATLCVNPGGTHGCFSTIGAAVAAAAPHDTVSVSAGTYKEDVVIGKPLSLIGASANNTIIDATGLSNGVYVDGRDNPGLRNVVVKGFTMENANFEGILVTNASDVTLWANAVTNNDKSLDIANGTCPGIPSFETGEDFDCGEGIHLLGVDHMIVVSNLVFSNSGGILLSDDVGETHDNLVSGNTVMNNAFDCGIVMASHPPASGSGSPAGVVHNTIANNQSFHNGYQVPGAGAGVGIFSGTTGGIVSGNVVVDNTLTANGLPGVAFHSHQPGDTLNDNVIVGNQISLNHADIGDAATPGPTGINIFGISPITGTLIAENTIDKESYDVVVNTPSEVDLHLNNLLDPAVGLDNLGAGTSNATENWWGCSAGPGAPGCSSIVGSGVLFTPWLTKLF